VAAALDWLVKDFKKRTGINCEVVARGVDRTADTVLSTAIFRIVQEALTNVARHAAASQVKVKLEKLNNTLILEVRDNGIGIMEGRIFDPKSLGLIGMRERVLLLGGEVAVSGRPGEGTLVRVMIPTGKGAISDA
jgi:signal transduction histidine kinase